LLGNILEKKVRLEEELAQARKASEEKVAAERKEEEELCVLKETLRKIEVEIEEYLVKLDEEKDRLRDIELNRRFVEGELASEGATVYFQNPAMKIRIPGDKAAGLKDYAEKRVIFGVRPDGRFACLDLTGKVVWMLPGGFRSNSELRITAVPPNSSATVVIVAGPNNVEPSGDDDVGIWCFSGIDVDATTNVVFVTDGRAVIEYYQEDHPITHAQAAAPNLSIYARKLMLIDEMSLGLAPGPVLAIINKVLPLLGTP
jgi:hypothetical protein